MPEIFDSATTKTRMTTEERRIRHVDEYSETMRQERPCDNPLAAFAAKPVETAFESQYSGEQVLLLLRQDLVTQVHHLFIIAGLVLLPLLFSYVGLLNFLPERFQFIATIGWYLMIVGYALQVFLDWFYNVYMITDERVIDIDFDNLLFKNISYAKLDHIEDITAKTSGALGSIFDHGDVMIQTAGAEKQFEFEGVPHPSKVVAFLNELLIKEEQEVLERRSQ